jgi:hypothetical protein
MPIPMSINVCFDKLEIHLNQALLGLMESHLKQRDSSGNAGEDTDFDRWIHGQIYQSADYNMV